MRPLLLRSAGAVGLAGTIVAVVSTDTFFLGSGETAEPAPAVWQEPHEADGPIAAVIRPSELQESGQPIVYTSEPSEPITPEPIAPSWDSVAFAPKASMPASELAELHQPPAVSPPAVSPPAVSPPEAPLATASVTAAVSPADLLTTSAVQNTEPPAVPSVELDLEAGASPLWVGGGSDCPRDWLPDTDQSSALGGCDDIVALLRPGGTDDVQEALEMAAEQHALKLSTLGPRVPRVRPEPPPDAIKKVAAPSRRTYGRNDWPAEPPPNCAPLHAYWRFVDHKAGTKEVVCK